MIHKHLFAKLFILGLALTAAASRFHTRQDNPDDDGTPSTPPIVYPDQCEETCARPGDPSLCDNTVTTCVCREDIFALIVECFDCQVLAGTLTQDAANAELAEFEEICPEPRPSGPNNPQNPDTPTATSPDSGGNTSTTPAGGNTSTSDDPPTTTATSPTNSETGEAVAGNSALNLHVEPILLFSTLIGMVMGRFL